MWKAKPYNIDYEKIFLRQGKSKLIARLLSQRKINIDGIDDFLNSSYDKLSHPHTLSGTKEAADIFCKAALNKCKVLIIGDYDADGIISSVMLKSLCRVFNLECHVFLPSRLEHGYGLTKETIESIKTFDIPDLLIITDCGSNNDNEIKKLKEIGIKQIIIIDHHVIDEAKKSKSADVLINHHLSDSESYCSCGEVYQFIRSVRNLTKKVNPIEFLSYAAIGTIADVVPLNKDNRILVKNGLKINALNHVWGCGLHAIMSKLKLNINHLTQEDIQFKIAPRLNAMGRMEMPDFVLNLLMESNYDKAVLMFDELERCNNDRKREQKKIENEAKKIIESNKDNYKNGIVIYNEKWHIGVIGIVAAKLMENYRKPCLVIGKQGDKWKGSGRSIAGINLKEIMDDCSDVFENYGGHSGAAGFTVKENKIEIINDQFNKSCEKYYKNKSVPNDIRYYDAELKLQSMSLETASTLFNNLYPYNEEINPEPIFRISDMIISGLEEFSGDGWRLFIFRGVKDGKDIEFPFKMFFRNFGSEINGAKVDVYFSFPQHIENNPSLKVVDIVFKK